MNAVADDRKIVNIFRGGQLARIHQSQVVVGDVVQVITGMEIPSDGVLIEGVEVTTDESAMTGETDPMKKESL